MGKNVVVCLDGTDNEFGATNTNVVRLFQILVDDPAVQVRYYHPGVGTMGHPGAITHAMQKLTQVLGMAFGLGVTQDVINAYLFLMRYHREGDRIYILGFSRGALEARALAGLLYRCGLLKSGLETLVPYAVRVFQTPGNRSVADQFLQTFSRPVDVHFMGLWDTVTSFGNVGSPIYWPNTTNNPGVRIVRHAIALDERRAFFRQNRWAQGDATQGQDVKERWFVGVHCDVGGGYPTSQSSLWTVTMEWLATEAMHAKLELNPAKLDELLEDGRRECGGGPGWLSALHDSMPGLGPLWYVAEFVPKRRWVRGTAGSAGDHDWMWPVWYWFMPWLLGQGKMGRERSIGRARELRAGDRLHRSVLERFASDLGYRPDSLLRIGMTEATAKAFIATGNDEFVVPP